MTKAGEVFGREPILWLGALQAIIALAVGFGLNLDGQQVALIMAAAAAILALIGRGQVTPVE